jgi:hypothetical protein
VVHVGVSCVGGTERRKVVDVPKDRRAAPGSEMRAATVPGLSPVIGETIQSRKMSELEI